MSHSWLAPDAGLRHALSSACPAVLHQRFARWNPRAGRARKEFQVHVGSKWEAERALESVQSRPKQIGSEHGEGFVQFAMSGPQRLDVDTLNEQLKAKGANRLRYTMYPDEAFGMLFRWENVVADTHGLQLRAWRRLAEEAELPWPHSERDMYDLIPERVIMEVLQWTDDFERAKELSFRIAELFLEELEQLTEVDEGLMDWLGTLRAQNVPCAVVSSLPNILLKAALERMNLSRLFQVRVTAEDDCETLSEQLLAASLKLERPPNNCVVFESTINGIAAAHNATMKVVALQGRPYKGFQLKEADLTCACLSELTVWNVRRLFALRGAEHMDREFESPVDPPKYRRTANATMD